MEPQILEEVEFYIDRYLKPNIGKPFDTAHNISQATCNVLSQLLYGKRFDYEDKVFRTMISAIEEIVALNVKVAVIENWPFGSYILKSSVDRDKYLWQSIIKPTMNMYIQEHQANIDREHPKDVTDRYLIHSESAEGEKAVSFSSKYRCTT